MPNSWGRPPRNDIWQDLQVLGFWVLIIGVVGYILFPNLFSDVYTRLTDPGAQVVDTSGTYDPNQSYYDNSLYNSGIYDSSSLDPALGYSNSSTTSSLYNLNSEVSSGYWVLFVADGTFKQLSVTSESYTFLQRLIEKDKNSITNNTVILTANGQIRKYVVSDEIYTIITSMASIDTRAMTS
jgi:hypothetical protein